MVTVSRLEALQVHPEVLAHLDTAVPAWVDKLRVFPDDVLLSHTRSAATGVVKTGGALVHPRAAGHEAARDMLAQGLACLAFAPGGVQFQGRRWQAER